MTKKSKRRAIKTGNRTHEGPRNTTVTCGINIYKDPKDNNGLPVDSEESDDRDISTKESLTRSQKKILQEQKQCESIAAYQKENNKRHVYPIDLWFLLAQNIKPEQVKVFSLVCKGAYYVITTRKFWLDLYRRYTTDHQMLPCHLSPKGITTNVGMKARVIRSLYYSYAPFVERTTHFAPTTIPLEKVEDKSCQSYWWKQVNSSKRNATVWMLYFKLVPPGRRNNINNIFKVTELIKYNPERKCCLLRVTSASFINITDVSGLHLTGVSINVSRDMQHHRVKLTFHEYRRNGKYMNIQATIVIIDPVLDIHVLSWWDPEYPHPLDN